MKTCTCAGSFREQVATVSTWFEQWNPCEQTVALYSLLKKLAPVQARFLGLCLAQQGVQSSKDMRIKEQNANDDNFVRQLEGASQLVAHLPLLRPGNEAAKRLYLEQIPIALEKAVQSNCQVEEARQLLSYALIHPALSGDERRALGLWLRHLEQCIQISSSNSALPLSTSSLNNNITNNNNNSSSNNNNSVSNINNSNLNNNAGHVDVQIGGLGAQAGCTLPSSQASQLDGSSQQLDTCSLSSGMTDGGGGGGTWIDAAMKDVMGWLKTLRLHKYSSLLMAMTYEQMLELTEEQLEARGVTQGARNKLILNIKKLQQRQPRLQSLSKQVETGAGDLKLIMEEIKQMLFTPMKAYPISSGPEIQDGDIPSEITRLLGKMCSSLLVNPLLDSTIVQTYISLLDKCVYHEAFNSLLKKRIASWRQQMTKLGRRRPFTLPWIGGNQESRLHTSNLLSRTRTLPHVTQMGSTNPSIHRLLSPSSPPTPSSVHVPMSSHPSSLSVCLSVDPKHSPCSSTGLLHKSLPSPNHTSSVHSTNSSSNNCHHSALDSLEFEHRLESLCLSVTEHAIGDSFTTIH